MLQQAIISFTTEKLQKSSIMRFWAKAENFQKWQDNLIIACCNIAINEQLNEYTGRYFSNELEVLYTIAINEKNKLTVKLYTSPTLELVPLEQDTFSETSMINTDLIFIRNEIGKVTKLELSNGRTQGVVFERMP